MRIRTVSADDFHQVLHLLGEAFPDVSRSFFHSITHFDPWHDDRYSLAVEVDNKLVSFLQLFDRTISLGGHSVRIGGIGSVGTHPKHRGKGYASQLLKHAQSVMENNEMAGGILFTKIQPFYEKLGWKRLPLVEQEVSISLFSSNPNPPYTFHPMRERDLEELHGIYQKEQQHIPGMIQRSIPYWKNRVKWMDHTCRVIRHNQEIAAYFYGAKYRDDVPTLHLTEWGFKHHDTETVAALFQAAVELAHEKRCASLRANFLVHPSIKEFFQNNQITPDDDPYNYIMMLDVDGSGLYNAVTGLTRQNQFVYWQTDAF